MLCSMTGYGRGEYVNDEMTFTVEIKSVNHRYIDIFIKMPKKLIPLEEKIKREIKKYINRGRVELFISLEEKENNNVVIKPNYEFIKQYYDALLDIKNQLKIDEEISLGLLTNHPDSFKIETKDADEEIIWQSLLPALNDALISLSEMRKKEGAELSKDINNRAVNIRNILNKIEARAPLVIEEYRKRLLQRIEELLGGNVEIDEGRLALEVALFAEKSSITEEIVRLHSHLEQLGKILESEDVAGKKLDFLVQEMNREINTIGSKSSDIYIAKNVIEIKSELEKIREQVQNIE